MTKPIGPTFVAELAAAGLLGLNFSWSSDGTFTFDPSMTQQQIAAVQAVYAAHDPMRLLAPDNYKPMIRYRADKLEAAGDSIGALKLRLTIGDI